MLLEGCAWVLSAMNAGINTKPHVHVNVHVEVDDFHFKVHRVVQLFRIHWAKHPRPVALLLFRVSQQTRML